MDSTTATTTVLVRVVHGNLSASWSGWSDQTFDEVVEKVAAKVREGSASARGMEVIEISVHRRVLVKPEIVSVDIAEATS